VSLKYNKIKLTCFCIPVQVLLQTTHAINTSVYNEQELRRDCSSNEKSKDFHLLVRTSVVLKKKTNSKPYEQQISKFLHFFSEKSGNIWKKIIQLFKIQRVRLKPKVCNGVGLK